MVHPFRFGVSAAAITDIDEFVAAARRAEELGYASFAIADHLGDQLAPLLALAAASAATTTIRLQTMVLANDYRHPTMLAKEATTLDQISGGRLELGVGAGWMRADYEQAGLTYDRPGIRIERLAEAVTILRSAFAGGPVDFDGEHYTTSGLVNGPPPIQPGGPPLLIAGGARRILSLAARQADIVGVNVSVAPGVFDERVGATATPVATDDKLTWIRDAAGDRFDDIELNTRVQLATITDDREEMAAALAPGFGIAPDDALHSPHALVGTVDECVASVQAWRERWAISYVTIPVESMEAIAPVVARLAGT